MVYLITFGCYGCHLPGDQRGSVERRRGTRGGYLDPSPHLQSHAQHLLKSPPLALNRADAGAVLEAIKEVCLYRQWLLLAAHIRSTHAHVVLNPGAAPPEKVIADFKAYASRKLNAQDGTRERWARGGNAARLSSDEAVRAAIRYVADRQGVPMAVFVSG
jgi:REP element-mobilizing transposase RayT